MAILEEPHFASIEAAPEAVWERINPVHSYRPASKTREVEPGAHLMFLQLKHLLREGQSGFFHKALKLFADKHGLLGLFQRDYLPEPVLPEQKFFVAPEAVFDGRGALRIVDPSTEGLEFLLKLKEHDPWFVKLSELASSLDVRQKLEASPTWEAELRSFKQTVVAMPSDIRFVPKVAGYPYLEGDRAELVQWEVIKKQFGALLVLDGQSESGVSVLCTREPLFGGWLKHLEDFPSPGNMQPAETAAHLSRAVKYVSPRALVDEHGSFQRGWRCSSLLEAMYIMLLWDLTNDNAIKKCESRGCPNYFLKGSQSKSKYCSERCANRASTRKRRGQEP